MFVTLEGGEGAGKSTQARRLAAWLAAAGHPVLLTREPGGAPGAETLRGLLLSGQHDWSAQAEMLLHFAARAEHLARTIRPALEVGMIVVCDRFYDSTMAYQGWGQGADRAQISALIGQLGIVPDVTFVLDVTERVAAGRMRGRGLAPDRYDRLGAGFHARVAAGFRAIAAAEPGRCRVLDASGPSAEVFESLIPLVMAGLDPAIHGGPATHVAAGERRTVPARQGLRTPDPVDGRVKPCHDGAQ